MEETYLSWAMIAIGIGIASAGVGGIFLPAGQRLAVVLTLMFGAGVGLAALFLLMLAGEVTDPEVVPRSFLIASIIGLLTVAGGLVLLFGRVGTER